MMRITTGLILLGGWPARGRLAQETPSPALLVLHKGENAMAIVDPASGKVVGRVPTGQDPHELAVSDDGKLAFASNYAGPGPRGGNTLSVIDIAARKELHRVELSPLSRPHGLWFADGKLYFTAEGSMAIGRYDPATNKVDWLLGLGQDRTHMILVSKDQKTIFTSNVSSNTISIIERGRTASGVARRTGRTSRAAPRWPADRRRAARVDRRPVDLRRAVGPPLMGRRADPGGPRRARRSARGGPGGGPGWRQTVVPVGRGPEGFDVSPDGKEFWTAHMGDGRISVIDVASKKVVPTIDAGRQGAQPPEVHPGRQARAGLRDRRRRPGRPGHRHAVREEARAARPRCQRHPDPARRRSAYVALTGDNAVAVIDLATLTEIARLKTGSGPDGMAWLPAK